MSLTEEKIERPTGIHTEKIDEALTSAADIDEKKLLRRIDMRLLPILFVMYVASYIDRVNMGNALTMGLQKDLRLTGNQPNIALTIFFVPYIIFEIPSNIVLKKVTPHVWFSICTMTFGVTMLAQGFVLNFSGILATRFILGLAESGLYPGCLYLISFWYRSEESQKRFTIFFCSLIIAGAFGGLLATAISTMDGLCGLHSWRWMFILEGLGTVLVGIASYFLIPEFPEHASWLSDEERAFVKRRAGHDKVAQRSVRVGDIIWFFKSPRRVLGAFMGFGIIIPSYSYVYFAPTIIKSLGYSVVQTQLRSVVPFAVALAWCVLTACLSDSIRRRMPFVLFGQALAIVGLAILMNVQDRQHFPTEYGALCLLAMGIYGASVGIACWFVMNLHGHVERSIGTAWMNSFSNVGGIVATFTFVASDAPGYRKGYVICIAATCFSLVSSLAYAAAVAYARKRHGNQPDVLYFL